jgi:hypothetical protein
MSEVRVKERRCEAVGGKVGRAEKVVSGIWAARGYSSGETGLLVFGGRG